MKSTSAVQNTSEVLTVALKLRKISLYCEKNASTPANGAETLLLRVPPRKKVTVAILDYRA